MADNQSNSDTLQKVYYRMREVIEETGLPGSTLRYWESQFEQLSPRKDGHGNRYYTQQDIALIKQIKMIRDDLKITRIEAIRKELAGNGVQINNQQRAIELMKKVRQELTEIRSLLLPINQ